MFSPEWRRRIDRWREIMPRLFYLPATVIPFKMFSTFDRLSITEAKQRSFNDLPPGTSWGKKWEYGWFNAVVQIPRELAARRIVMKLLPGAESLVYLNGEPLGGNSVFGWDTVTDSYRGDMGGRLLLLSPCAKGEEIFEIMVEAYAGDGDRECGGGPCPFGTQLVKEPEGPLQILQESTFGIWREDIFQLWLDTATLLQLSDGLADKNSLRAAEIDEALMQMTLTVDFELPPDEMHNSIKAGRKILQPALEAKNGSVTGELSCIGHSHLDIAWCWPIEESIRKTARTFGSQLALMDEYPEYRFLQSQPQLYVYAKEYYPDLYKRLKHAVKRGQWIPEGGMWVEADSNIPSGESLIRQIIHGKRFFLQEFGVDSRLLWLPDVFGYSGALPQIMRGCGIDFFSTQKIFWTYNGGDPFPYNQFVWEGIDGSKILAYIFNDYNSQTSPAPVFFRWNERAQKDAAHKRRLVPFGWGDGGGGPTREHLEFLRREKNLQGLPKCEIVNPLDFFTTLKMSQDKLPAWVGELYFQAHRGTYTAQAWTKMANRKSEIALHDAEFWSSAALVFKQEAYPSAQFDSLWKMLLLNQFHDILPGSSIAAVYERNRRELSTVREDADSIAGRAQKSLLKDTARTVTAFNSTSFERTELLELPEGFRSIQGAPEQTAVNGKTLALLTGIPPCGVKSFKAGAPAKLPEAKAVIASGLTAANEFISIKMNPSGQIESLVENRSGLEFFISPGNCFRLYKDVPSWFDAWDIDSMYKEQEVQFYCRPVIKLVENGPLRVMFRLEQKFGESTIVQDIIMYALSPRIDFVTNIDWQEKHKLLKVDFPFNLIAEDALQEIQFGHVRRPTHFSKPYDRSRFEVCNHKWTALCEEGRGTAILNDSKYGVNVAGSTISLSLLRAPVAPAADADKGLHKFTYSLLPWHGPLLQSPLIKEAYALNFPVNLQPGATATRSLFSLDADAVVIETLKAAEDGSGDIIIRLYEALRSSVDCRLTAAFPFISAEEVDMLEAKCLNKIKREQNFLRLSFRPFEIKTIRLKNG